MKQATSPVMFGPAHLAGPPRRSSELNAALARKCSPAVGERFRASAQTAGLALLLAAAVMAPGMCAAPAWASTPVPPDSPGLAEGAIPAQSNEVSDATFNEVASSASAGALGVGPWFAQFQPEAVEAARTSVPPRPSAADMAHLAAAVLGGLAAGAGAAGVACLIAARSRASRPSGNETK